MGFFENTVTVEPNDLDNLNHVNNVRYVQWIQDISKEHWEKMAPEEIKGSMIWVVMSHNINYLSPAKLGDVIHVRTHIAKNKGAISTRVVEMFQDGTNTPLLRSSTQWCLLNARTNKPMRITEEIMRIFMPTDRV
ncbi:MAG: thioesterase family protein [Bacteroidota bacterium]